MTEAPLAVGSQAFAANVERMPELRRQFSALSDKLQRRALRSAWRKGARPIANEAKRLAPVDPSSRNPKHLRDAIRVRVSVRRKRVEARIGFLQDNFYGRFQEDGTAFHAAQPFLRPAIDTKADEALNKIASSLRTDILRVAAKARMPVLRG